VSLQREAEDSWAGKLLDRWCKQALRSRIEPMKKMARMLRKHRLLLLNWFRVKKRISGGVVEGLNNRLKLTLRKAYGFRTFEAVEVRSTIVLARYRSRNGPTNFAEEPFI
jgi:transposase